MKNFSENPEDSKEGVSGLATLTNLLRKDFEDILSNEEAKSALVGEKKKYLIKIIGEKSASPQFKDVSKEDFAAFINRLDALTPSTNEELLEQSLEVTTSFISEVFPNASALEESLRNTLVERNNWNELNKILAYEVQDDQIQIHVPVVLTEKPPHLKVLFVDGLRKLAHELKTNPSLQTISRIEGASWIILDHPKLVEALGFSLAERNEELGQATAFISRDKLLELYGR